VATVIIKVRTILTADVSKKMELLDSEQNAWRNTAGGWKLQRIYRCKQVLHLFSS
jgi:uncharacterized protein YpbB